MGRVQVSSAEDILLWLLHAYAYALITYLVVSVLTLIVFYLLERDRASDTAIAVHYWRRNSVVVGWLTEPARVYFEGLNLKWAQDLNPRNRRVTRVHAS